jgi:ubiquinone/menaquinone biosynthesis C-methylase UbiE
MDKVFHHSKWERLVSPERTKMTNPEEFFAVVSPPADSVWADIGCGPGFFTLPLAAHVNKVKAVDISQEMLDVCRDRAEAAQVSNIDYVPVGDHSLPLENDSIDFLLLVAVLHEYENRDVAVRELYRVLRPGGCIYIIDWKYEEMETGPPLDHRLPEQQVVDEMASHGLKALDPLALYDLHYSLQFEK